jgi:hypothetical protein
MGWYGTPGRTAFAALREDYPKEVWLRVGDVAYSAVTLHDVTIAGVALLERGAYKPMDETMGPYGADRAPAEILAQLTPIRQLPAEMRHYAAAWRRGQKAEWGPAVQEVMFGESIKDGARRIIRDAQEYHCPPDGCGWCAMDTGQTMNGKLATK